MTDATLSQALKEAYAAAPAGVVIYHTIELWHPQFSAPVRVVRDYVDLVATLESTAPRDASTAVTFVGFNFEFTKPEVSPNGVPQITPTKNNPPLAMTIMTVVADVFKITATAGFNNLMNKRFPTLEYSAETFVGLV